MDPVFSKSLQRQIRSGEMIIDLAGREWEFSHGMIPSLGNYDPEGGISVHRKGSARKMGSSLEFATYFFPDLTFSTPSKALGQGEGQ